MSAMVRWAPNLALNARKSAPVSPTVVHMILMTQNDRAIAGTLLGRPFRESVAGGVLIAGFQNSIAEAFNVPFDT